MTDIQELFARDPLTYTTEGGELRAIIERMRAARGQFNLGNKKAGSTKPPTAKQSASLKLLDQLDIKGLDL